jgi:hypothetical protein
MFVCFKFPIIERTRGGCSLWNQLGVVSWLGWVGLGWLAERIKRREKKKKITRDSKCKCPMLRLKSGLLSKFKSNIFWAQ